MFSQQAIVLNEPIFFCSNYKAPCGGMCVRCVVDEGAVFAQVQLLPGAVYVLYYLSY